MKRRYMKRLMLGLAVAMLCVTVTRADFTPPTDQQIEKLLADPTSLTEMVKGASYEQVADVVNKAIAKLKASSATIEQQKQVVALLTALAVDATGANAPKVMKLLVASVGVELLPSMAAAAAIASLSGSDALVAAMLEQLGPDTPAGKAAREAAAAPQTTLGSQLFLLVQRLVLPSEALAAKRVPGGAVTLPLPPPVRLPERRPVVTYRGQ